MFIILKGEIDEASITIGILRDQCIFSRFTYTLIIPRNKVYKLLYDILIV